MTRATQLTTRLLAVLLGLVPFVNIWRWPPDPAYWEDWATCVLACLWLLIAGAGRQTHAPTRLGPVTWTLLGLSVLTLVQAAAGLALQPLNALVVSLVLVLAACLCHTVQGLDPATQTRWLRDWAVGVLLALYANVAGELLGLQGFELLGGQIVMSTHPLRAIGALGQPNQLADVTVFAAAAALLRHRPDTRGRALLMLHWAVAGTLCAATGSRSGLLAWLIGLALGLGWLWRHRTDRGGRRWTAGLALAGLLPAVAMHWLHASDSATVLRTAVSGRDDLLLGAWQLWRANPLFGVGYGHFADARFFTLDGPLYSPNANHAHNLFAQVAAEWGGLGLTALLLPLGMAAWRNWQTRRRLASMGTAQPPGDGHNLFIATVLMAVMVHSQFEFPLWFNYFLLPCAMLAGLWRSPSDSPAAAPTWSGATSEALSTRRSGLATWVGAIGLMITSVLGLDYARLQTQALETIREQAGRAPRKAQEVLAQAGAISVLTAYPTYADLMFLRAIGHDAMLAPLSFDVARRTVRALPSAETITFYVIALAQNSRADEALQLLQRLSDRNAPMHLEVLARLAIARGQDPAIAELFDRANR